MLGHLSWRFVENVARPRSAAPGIGTARIAGSWRAVAAYGLPPLALALASLGIWRTHGLPQRFSAQVQATVADSIPRPVAGAGPCYSTGEVAAEPCRLGPAEAPVLAIFLGDSHSDSELLGLVEALPAGTRGAVLFNALAGCPPILGLRPVLSRNRCGDFNARFLEPLAERRRTPLVLTANWAGYSGRPVFRFPGDAGARPTPASFHAALLRSSCTLAAGGPTYVVLPTPQFPVWVTRELQRRLIADPRAPDLAMPYSAHEARNRGIIAVLRRAERSCGVRLLDPAPFLCPAGACQGSVGHRPLYRDDHHLTDRGARLLAPMFRRVFEDRSGEGALPLASPSRPR
jgi:hypothetical protein